LEPGKLFACWLHVTLCLLATVLPLMVTDAWLGWLGGGSDEHPATPATATTAAATTTIRFRTR
jgi:hypothetical protein